MRHLLLFSVLATLAGTTSYQKIIAFIALLSTAVKADQKLAASQPQAQPSKAAAEQPKTPAPPGCSEASAGQSDKSGQGSKG